METTTTPCALLVEDEPDHGLMLRILLERDGLSVVEAPDVGQVASLAARRRPDVVVVDVPTVADAGTARCRALRALPGLSDVPMVALSAAHDRDAREALFDAGVDGLLGKPVVPWLLEWQVRAALRRPARGGRPDAAALLDENKAWMSYLVHDMNNPLTVLGGSLALMGTDPLTPRQVRALQASRQAHDRLTRLVRSLLDVERVDAGGHLRLDVSAVSVPALLDEVRFVLLPTAAPRDIGIELACAGELLWPLDRNLVERALINLGENAVRHSPKGSLLILEAVDVGDHLRLSVIDEGPGVPEPVRGRIFERNVQVGERRAQGTAGLGLAFCKLVAEAHHGRAWVESGPGGGAVFSLELPWLAS